MLVLNQGCLGDPPQIVFSTALVKIRLRASKCFRFTSKEKPRESGASSRFGVCQDSLGPGEIGELSSPPLTLAVFRLAEIHSKEPGLHRKGELGQLGCPFLCDKPVPFAPRSLTPQHWASGPRPAGPCVPEDGGYFVSAVNTPSHSEVGGLCSSRRIRSA